MRRARRSQLLASLTAVILVGCAAPTPGGRSMTATSAASVAATVISGVPDPGFPAEDPQDPHRVATLLVVDAMLASTKLPSDARRVDTSPISAVDDITGPESPNLIDAVQWWTSSQSRKQVLQFAQDHPPTGTKGTGSNNLATITTLMFAPTSTDLAYNWPEVNVSVSDLPGGRSAIRVDAEAVWIPTRTPAETIPNDVTSVDVTLHFRGKTLKRTADGPAAVAIGRALNVSEPSAPVTVAGGYMEGDTEFTDELVFHGDEPDVAVKLTVDGPAAGAQISVQGQQQPTLAGYGTSGPAPDTVDKAIIAALGLPAGYRK